MHVCMHACIYAVRGKPVVTLLVSLVKPEREGNVWLVGCALWRNEKGLLAQRGVALGLGSLK